MSEQLEANVEAAESTEQVEKQPQRLTFAQYKQRLKNDVEIAELRARFAKAQFEEIAATNQYNQLTNAINQAMMQAQQPEVSTDIPDVQPEVCSEDEVEVKDSEETV